MNIRFILFFMVSCSTAWSGNVFPASVTSMSLEVFNDGEIRFWEVLVSCDSVDQPKAMRRPLSSEQWCSTDEVKLCDKNKFSLSRQLCNDNSNDPTATQTVVLEAPIQTKPDSAENTSSRPIVEDAETVAIASNSTGSKIEAFNKGSSKESLLNEKMQIEEQSILIQQRRLELRRRELSLQKQQLNTN